MSSRQDEMWIEFEDAAYRVAYSESMLDSSVATQIKVVREQRDYTQQQLAERAGMLQSRISTMEDVNYSSWSVKTLKRLAAALDCALDVRLIPYDLIIDTAHSISAQRMRVRSFVESKAARATRQRQADTGASRSAAAWGDR